MAAPASFWLGRSGLELANFVDCCLRGSRDLRRAKSLGEAKVAEAARKTKPWTRVGVCVRGLSRSRSRETVRWSAVRPPQGAYFHGHGRLPIHDLRLGVADVQSVSTPRRPSTRAPSNLEAPPSGVAVSRVPRPRSTSARLIEAERGGDIAPVERRNGLIVMDGKESAGRETG